MSDAGASGEPRLAVCVLSEDSAVNFNNVLSPAERQRARQFVRPLRRAQYRMGRVLLRVLLAEPLGCAPFEVPLAEPAHGGAPRLPTNIRLHFSVSHSGDFIVCAVDELALGVDVEDMRRKRDVAAVAAQALTPAECAWQSAQPDPQLAFYRLWTQREAMFKLFGRHSPPNADDDAPLALPLPARSAWSDVIDGAACVTLVSVRESVQPRLCRIDAGPPLRLIDVSV